MRFQFYFLLLFAIGPLSSFQVPAEHLFPDHEKLKAPWFTGPLLTPSPALVPKGHINIEPYLFTLANRGSYDNNWNWVKTPTSWNNFFQPTVQIGATSWLEVDLVPTIFWNYNHGKSKWVWGDLSFAFAIKLLQTKRPIDKWNVALRLEFNGVIPFGKYQRLDPSKLGTDIGGTGSWRPGIGFDWGNFFYIGGGHFVAWRTSFIYKIPNPVKVHGLNTYGGDERTLGTVYPSKPFIITSAMEISLTQNWVIVMEAQASWGSRTRYKGVTTLPMTRNSFAQISLAPAIEYNWSSHIGIIFGPWFTIAGRNSANFAGGVFALNYFN